MGVDSRKREGAYHAVLGWSLLNHRLIAGVLGLAGVAGTATYIAYVLFVLFVIIAIISFIIGRRPPAGV